MTQHHNELRLSDEVARRILARAAEIDGVRVSEVTLGQLRQIALESGIGPQAFDAAAREIGVAEASPTVSVPLWVRLCMFGVPDRRAATVFYWLFGVAMCAWLLRALIDVPGVGEPNAAGIALGMGFCGFALWSTSRAIRWLDRHGWKSLP